MTESFSANASPYLTHAAAACTSTNSVPPVTGEIDFQPGDELISQSDWQPHESDLLPGFGVERARELLMWLINLEIRLPPYTEVSPA